MTEKHKAVSDRFIAETANGEFIKKAGSLMVFNSDDVDMGILKMVTKIKAIDGMVFVTDDKGERRSLDVEKAISRLQYFEIRLAMCKEGSLLYEAFNTIYFMLHREVMRACDQKEDASNLDCNLIQNVLEGKHESGKDWSEFELDKHGFAYIEERRRNEQIIDCYHSYEPINKEIPKNELFGIVSNYVDRVSNVTDQSVLEQELNAFKELLYAMNEGLKAAREAGERTGITS